MGWGGVGIIIFTNIMSAILTLLIFNVLTTNYSSLISYTLINFCEIFKYFILWRIAKMFNV